MNTKKYEGMSRQEREEKITNRVLINFGYVLAGYVVLYFLYLYAYGQFGHAGSYVYVMLGIMIACILGAGTLYFLAAKKNPKHKNYAHMLVGLAVTALYLNIPFYTTWWRPDPNSLPFLALKNTQNAFIITAVAMLVYLVGTIVYNTILMSVLTRQSRSKKVSKKASK